MRHWFKTSSVHNQITEPQLQLNIGNLCNVLKKYTNSGPACLGLIMESGGAFLFPLFLMLICALLHLL